MKKSIEEIITSWVNRQIFRSYRYKHEKNKNYDFQVGHSYHVKNITCKKIYSYMKRIASNNTEGAHSF